MVTELRSLLEEIVAARVKVSFRGDKLELKGRRVPEKLRQAVEGAQPLLQVYFFHLTWAEGLIDEVGRLMFSRRRQPTSNSPHLQKIVEDAGELALLRIAAATEGVWWQVLTLSGELLDEGGKS